MFKVLYFIGGILLGVAWLFPESYLGAFLSLIFAVLIAYIYNLKPSYFGALLLGISSQSIGFYWLINTIKDFGGYNLIPAIAIFTLFVVCSSLQFLIFTFLFKYQPLVLKKLGLALPLAWIVAEFLPIKIFPWELGHSFLKLSYFCQIADIFGSPVISFLILYLTSIFFARSIKFLILPVLTLLLTFLYGYKIVQYYNNRALEVRVDLIQGNLSIEKKHNIAFFKDNLATYQDLSNQLVATSKPTLIVWPESVITSWVNPNVNHVSNDNFLPVPRENQSYLVGALSAESKEKYFNSAFLINPDGRVDSPYHKQVLMPFGEYMPFSKLIPSIKKLNPTAGDFTAGTRVKIFTINFNDSYNVKVSPLICYEDISAKLALQATYAGAEVLVNLTNDVWFGDTVAPYQHNQIAAFRALENKRYLLRATNTGLTSVISPIGKTIATVKPFTSDVLSLDIAPIKHITIYTSFLGGSLWYILSLFVIIIALIKKYSP